MTNTMVLTQNYTQPSISSHLYLSEMTSLVNKVAIKVGSSFTKIMLAPSLSLLKGILLPSVYQYWSLTVEYSNFLLWVLPVGSLLTASY